MNMRPATTAFSPSKNTKTNTTMSNYDFGNSGGNSRGYAPTFRTSPFTKLGGNFERAMEGSSDWGQSIGVVYENGTLVDGIVALGETKHGNPVYKTFAISDAPVMVNEDLSVDDLSPILTAGRENKQFYVIAARIEANEDEGYGTSGKIFAQFGGGTEPRGDADSLAEAQDAYDTLCENEDDPAAPIPLELLGLTDDSDAPEDRFAVWESSTKHGPNSSAKTTTKVLTEQGAAAVLDPDAKFNWLDESVNLRPELQDMRVTYAKVKKASNKSDNDFHHVIFVDDATGNTLRPDNANGGSQNDDSAAQAESESESETPEAVTDGGDDPMGEFYDAIEEIGVDTENAVIGLMGDMIEDPNYPAVTADSLDEDKIRNDLVA